MTDLLVLYQQKRHIFYQQMKKKKLCSCGREDRAARGMTGSIKIEQNEAVHGQTGGVNICHVNRSSSNVAHPPLYFVRLLEITVRELGPLSAVTQFIIRLEGGGPCSSLSLMGARWLIYPILSYPHS